MATRRKLQDWLLKPERTQGIGVMSVSHNHYTTRSCLTESDYFNHHRVGIKVRVEIKVVVVVVVLIRYRVTSTTNTS